MSTSDKKRRPLRKLVFLAVLAGIAVAIKNAFEDKGGSYEAPAPAQPSAAPVPTPPVPHATVVTAEDVVRQPVENLDEFADPVEPDPEVEPDVDEVATDDEPEIEAPTRVEPAIASDLAEDPDDARTVPGKIDPFGIR